MRCCYYNALKAFSADCYGGSNYLFDLEVFKRLRDSDPGHPYIPTLADSFEHIGPRNRHVCLVLELARLHALFSKCQVPSHIIQRFTKQLSLL